MTVIDDVRHLRTSVGGNISKAEVSSSVKSYEDYHACYGGDEIARKNNYADMVNKYYDLATSFYEYGWGQSFHFAHRLKEESLKESIKRHEHYIALQLGLKRGMKVLDVGCGIGGPLREIAAFSGASITGLNNNAYQISRGIKLNEDFGLHEQCGFVKADFMKIPNADNFYDAVYTIEATCHAPDVVACYKEIKRVLKPGGLFAGYEWCMTDAYDPSDYEHQQIKKEIELGNGLPDVRTTNQCLEAFKAAGFEVLVDEDLARVSPTPWYAPLDTSRISLSNFHLTKVGRFITHYMVSLLEFLRLAPEGSVRVSNFLEKGGDALVAGGRLGLFTPMYFFLLRKPIEE